MTRKDFLEMIQEDEVEKAVEHPDHYTQHKSGIECIQVTQHFNFNKGNAIKYIWRAGTKGDEIEDLRKAMKYLQFEIERVINGRYA